MKRILLMYRVLGRGLFKIGICERKTTEKKLMLMVFIVGTKDMDLSMGAARVPWQAGNPRACRQ